MLDVAVSEVGVGEDGVEMSELGDKVKEEANPLLKAD